MTRAGVHEPREPEISYGAQSVKGLFNIKNNQKAIRVTGKI
jgi:hypothetical protein